MRRKILIEAGGHLVQSAVEIPVERLDNRWNQLSLNRLRL
jgi:hypothetical protein